MSKILTIDIGTTACKVIVFDLQGNILAKSNREYPTYTPQIEWAEQDPNDWWSECVSGIKECLQQTDGSSIVAIGLSSQRETVVPLDKDGNILYRAISWMDRRSRPEAEEISQEFGKETIHKITGLIPDSTFTATKLLWFKKYEPDVLKKATVFLQPKEFIGYKLTGEAATDHSLASRTMMFDITKRQWWQDIFEFVGVKLNQFPRLCYADEIIGYLKDDVAKMLGLKSGIPVISGGGDRPLEAVGAGIIGSRVMESTGTATNVSMSSNKVPELLDPRVVCSCHVIRDYYLIEQGISTSGTILRWVRDNLYRGEKEKGENAYEIIDKEAENSSPGANGIVLLPFFMGSRATRWNPDARGVLFGLTLTHSRGDIARSVLEGISYEIRACIEILEGMGLKVESVVSMGGGAKSTVWSKIKADILGKKVIVEKVSEAASKGAMLLAAVAIGARESLIEEKREVLFEYTPNPDNQRVYDRVYEIYNELYNSVSNIYPKISEILS
ncbi:xylulokinase [Caldicellulosiruptor changbaiensis]|uniref:Xylulose kinase n=1 Tax=Caldicellulosiruptor changbaiensis TaxID=1222016 RepID=A0A3T0D2I9_9FIRM|nr:xylulokinase [Caldicellulosiruptor changbaiensis]AZT89481.1 xylulokinase [Caldicellulosiruptor changbaiensis]